MEFWEGVEEPVSPTGQYFNSSILSVAILAVLEFEVPIDDFQTVSLLRDVFLPINPRFSCIMVIDDVDQKKHWKRVEVKLEEHVHVPIFPGCLNLDLYLDDYISNIAAQKFPQNRPLWEIHILKYPTSHSAGTLIFKLHHALGDGYSLMGALLSCLQSARHPSIPLTFPSLRSSSAAAKSEGLFGFVGPILSSVFHTVSDFSWSILKSVLVQDDRTPIRSGVDGVEFRPITLSTLMFSVDQIKVMKNKLEGVTTNDVIAGIIFLGTRIYMQEVSKKPSNESCTALVLLNTRNIEGYMPIKEMIGPNAEMSWGNRFGFLHVSIPKSADVSDPLEFVWEARKIIQRKRSSAAGYLTSWLLDILKKFRGPEAAARFIHSTLKSSSMTVSNMIGPLEQMALANHPISGLYFMVVGPPQSLTITALSYMGKLRVAFGAEKGFIDSQKLKACMEQAFQVVCEATDKIPPKAA